MTISSFVQWRKCVYAALSVALLLPILVDAKVVEYTLVITKGQVVGRGRARKPVEGIMINGETPGPTLYFEEGDLARIHVQNAMDVNTSLHWHGVLLPNDMDGVPYLTYPPIAPHKTFTYEFPIRQTGTYWYHSHTDLQEQSGMYGSIVIYPKGTFSEDETRTAKANEKVVVLSDWLNESPETAWRTLRQSNEWFSIKKRSAQSLLGAVRLGLATLTDYLKRELQRMPAADIADVGYDAFLLNGSLEDNWDLQPNAKVRLRVINASSSSFFFLQYAGGAMTIVAADGIAVAPVEVQCLPISIAETYDIVVTVPDKKGAYELRATVQDNSGYTSLWLGSGAKQVVPAIPYPNLYRSVGAFSWKKLLAWTPAAAMGLPTSSVKAGAFDQPTMLHPMGGMPMAHQDVKPQALATKSPQKENDAQADARPEETHAGEKAAQATKVEKSRDALPQITRPPSIFAYLASDVSSHPNLVKVGSRQRPWPSHVYKQLRALAPTSFSKEHPVRKYHITLDGDMDRYVWLMDNEILQPDNVIRVRQGEVARFIIINRTKMHHPMHLHGHFFRLINGQGDRAPLKHTVDVAPMSTVVIEFEADEVGDWFFHCHNLYHLKAGMRTFVHYEGFTPSAAVRAVRKKLYRDPYYVLGEGYLLTSMTSGTVQLANTRNIFMGEWEYGFQDTSDEAWEFIATYNRYFNRFFAVFSGVDVVDEDSDGGTARGILGFTYLLPLSLSTRIWVDTDLGARFSIGRSITLTPRLTFNSQVEYDTHLQWEGVLGLDFQLLKNFFLSGRWHSDYKWGIGGKIVF